MKRIAFIVFILLAQIASGAEVRPPSDAERAAAAVVADYLARGPQAVVDQLASSSPLRKLSPSDASAEVEARLGPHEGARWEMQTVVPALKDKRAAFYVAFPSGVDDSIFFDMAKEGDAYRIVNVRTLAEPSDTAPLFSAATARPSTKLMDAASLGVIAGALLVALAIFLLRRSPIGGRIVLLLGSALGTAGVLFGLWTAHLLTREVKQVDATTQERLGALVTLRREVSSGGMDVGAAFAAVPSSGDARRVAELWKTQTDLVQMRLDAVRRTLDTYPDPSNVPLVELLRARLALLQNDDGRAVAEYQHAINIGPGRDALWIEAAEAFLSGGYGDLGSTMLRRAANIGSRNATVYYAQSTEALAAGKFDESDATFKQGWGLMPVQRSHLVGTGLLWAMVRQKGAGLVNLSTPQEATFAAPDVSARAIALPQNAHVRVSGQLLEIETGDSELVVPGGATLAPKEAAVVDAGAWQRLASEQALKDVPQLIKDAATPGAYMQPVLRQRITRAANVLYGHNRWNDLAALTAGITPKWQFIDTDVLLLRAEALRRLAREGEAKQLLMDLSASPVVSRRNQPETYEQLGDALAGFDQYDAAIDMYSKAKALRSETRFDSMRIVQIAMNRALATKFNVYETPHFHVHYPGVMSIASAVAVGKVLEGELNRLQNVVPVPDFKPVVVNIVPWPAFKAIYTDNGDILGFYNRDITIPLADITDLDPEITAIVTHELCHALIAQATHDQAPHWFHEGLAQRVEMVPYSANAFNMYEDDKLLAVSVIDPVLTRSSDEGMIGAGYIVSETFIRYLEAKYGDRAIKQLLASFASGANTDEALQALSGTSAAAVDADFRAWGRAEKRVFQNPPPVIYTLNGEDMIQRAQPEVSGHLTGGTFHPIKVNQ